MGGQFAAGFWLAPAPATGLLRAEEGR